MDMKEYVKEKEKKAREDIRKASKEIDKRYLELKKSKVYNCMLIYNLEFACHHLNSAMIDLEVVKAVTKDMNAKEGK